VPLVVTGALIALVVWLVLLLGRDGFWRARPRIEDEAAPEPASWPAVVAVIPARDEAETVAEALRSLLAQDYPGTLDVILVDDHSADATRAIAEQMRDEPRLGRRLEVIAARALPVGWSGKLWAVSEGLRRAVEIVPDAPYLLLTDADIRHGPQSLRRLVTRAELDALDLTSLMVRLRCASVWERLLIPPFVFFFQKLYPFAAVNDPARRTAAAAGGCMLVRQEALAAIGGIEAIRGALIDDVALARAIKRRPGGGRIWLGLTGDTTSLRRYDTLGEIWAMVARTADAQLGHSPVLLLVTLVGMTIIYLVPPLALLGWPLHGDPWAAGLGLLAWLLMAMAFRPTLRLYGLAPLWALTLPAAAALYTAMTVDSALQYRRGRGGLWKGRTHPAAREGDSML
jgi:hopene-associated glycosyltransferase HpnB